MQPVNEAALYANKDRDYTRCPPRRCPPRPTRESACLFQSHLQPYRNASSWPVDTSLFGIESQAHHIKEATPNTSALYYIIPQCCTHNLNSCVLMHGLALKRLVPPFFTEVKNVRESLHRF
ncbi:hypothetical protein J6590_063794 [Homalodisca vitripennis]|nr:hypothetical protein J6590_063794 [Homalodisca vitripennis]